jgi:hypothetical protein
MSASTSSYCSFRQQSMLLFDMDDVPHEDSTTLNVNNVANPKATNATQAQAIGCKEQGYEDGKHCRAETRYSGALKRLLEFQQRRSVHRGSHACQHEPDLPAMSIVGFNVKQMLGFAQVV